MVYIFLRHRVEDYDAWKTGFDAHASTREEYGSTENYELFCEADDPNEICMLAEWESPEEWERFMEESDVRELMPELGVVSDPEIYVLDQLEARTPRAA